MTAPAGVCVMAAIDCGSSRVAAIVRGVGRLRRTGEIHTRLPQKYPRGVELLDRVSDTPLS